MTYEIKPTGSTQFVNNGINTTANAHTVGLIASGSGTTGRRWRMRYEFAVPVQMASVDVEFILSGGSGYERNLTVGITDDAQTIAPADATVTLESKTIRATLEKMLYPDRSYYLWLGYPGRYFDSWTCKEDKVTIIATPAASTLSAGDGTLGEEQTLTITAGSEELLHDIVYKAGSAEGVIAEKTTASEVKWTPPLELAAQNTEGKSVSCTLTIITYAGDAENGRNEVDVTYAIPESCGPLVEISTSTENGTLPDQFNELYVQGRSKVRIDYEAEAQYGATIAGFLSTVGKSSGEHNDSSFISDILSVSGSVSVKGKATDTRGYSGEDTKTITVQEYEAPAIIPVNGKDSVICGRANDNGVMDMTGLWLRIQAGKKFSSVAGVNRCILRYRVSKDHGAFGSWVTLLDRGSDAEQISLNTDVGLLPTSTYVVEINVEDDVGESATSVFQIPTLDVPLHLGNGGKNIGLGRYCDYSEPHRIDVGWDIYMAPGKTIYGNVSGGTGDGNGATFTPHVDLNGNLSWTNDKGLPNPDTVNIRGPQGLAGVAVQTAGYVSFNVTEDGHLMCTYTGDEQPNYSINSDGHLVLEI